MIDNEDQAPAPKLDLERLSEDELLARIEALKTEIKACEAELERKRSHRSAADALFSGD
ncbi:MAG: DUF1192 domain-containing protein [Pseudomonadota bacterium]